MDKLHAKIKLGEYLKKKYPNHKNIVMEDPIQDFLDTNFFENMFGSPFNFKF